MTLTIPHGVVMACITVITLSPQIVDSQIPTMCTDAESLKNMVCCPDNCNDRGRCAIIDLDRPLNMSSTDVRSNWPHYFTWACHCDGNYGGFDCSRCTYGYYGDNCENSATLPRTSIQSLTPEEWRVYIETLKMARDNDSRYSVIIQEAQPGTPDLSKREVTIYELFVWLHHYTAKDSECTEDDQCTKVDYAHEATGFPTWHRHFLLWFEWEIQYMLKINGRTDYHMFRTHYWDWRSEKNMDAENIFHADRLGEILSMSQVDGTLFSNDWNTICWFKGNLRDNVDITNNRVYICDPTIPTGVLLRCPSHTDPEVTPSNPCNSSNENWPDLAAVEKAINKPLYDTSSYNKYADDQSFRNFMEGFEGPLTPERCQENPLCSSGDMIQRHLHNAVHIITGFGDFNYNTDDNRELVGVMADVAASPNDPIFINHHTMIDCILEEWLKKHRKRVYPEDVGRKGHKKNDYIVPFFPLYKHSDRFNTAENFGYSCTLNSAIVSKPLEWIVLVGAISSLISAMSI